jgi:hypothetical protein
MKRICTSVIAALAIITPVSIAAVFTTAAHAIPTNTAEDNFTRPNMAGTWGTTTNNDGLPNLGWKRSLGGYSLSPYVNLTSDHGTLTFTGHNDHKIAGFLPTAANQGGDLLEEATFSNLGHAMFGATLDNDTKGSQWYQAEAATQSADLEIVKRDLGIMTTEATTPFTFTAGQPYWLREDVSVTAGVATVAMRVWADGTTEPTTWQLTWTDPSPLAAGFPGTMADWIHTPVPGDHVSFSNWAFAATGFAVPAT